MKILVALLSAFAVSIHAQSPIVTTAAGTGVQGFDGETGVAPGPPVWTAMAGFTRDTQGNLIFADLQGQRIRRLSPDFTSISTLVGTGAGKNYSETSRTIPAASAGIIYPIAVAHRRDGTIAFADNSTVRVYNPATSTVTILAGEGFSTQPSVNGPGAFAAYSTTIAVHDDGRIFYITPQATSTNNGRVRVIKDGVVSDLTPNTTAASLGETPLLTLASDGNLYLFDGNRNILRIHPDTGTRQPVASLGNRPLGLPANLVEGEKGVFYLSDSEGHRIYRLYTDGTPPVQIAGTGVRGLSGLGGAATAAQLHHPAGLHYDSAASRLYIGEIGTSRLLYIDDQGRLQLAAGGSSPGFSGEPRPANAAQSRVGIILGMAAAPDGSLYYCDATANRINRLTPGGAIVTVAGGGAFLASNGAMAKEVRIGACRGLALDSKLNVYFFDNDWRIKRIDAATGRISFFAGNGSPSAAGPGPARADAISLATGLGALSVDAAGNVYIADTAANVIRKITPTGEVTTAAGTGGRTGDFRVSGPASSAILDGPWATALSPDGTTLYFTTNQSVIRALDLKTGSVRYIGGSTTRANTGNGGPAANANFERIEALAVDASGRLFAGHGNVIRSISATGVVDAFAGSATAGFSGDGGSPQSAVFRSVWALAVASDGAVYVSDDNARIRRIGLPGAATLSVISGDSQVLDFGEPSQPLVVEAKTAQGTPAAGVPVSFAPVSQVIRTGPDGRAALQFTAGAEPGPATVVASTIGTAPAVFNYSVIGPIEIAEAVNAFDGSAALAPGSLLRVKLRNVKGSMAGVALSMNDAALSFDGENGVIPPDTEVGSRTLTAGEPGRPTTASVVLDLTAYAPVIQLRDDGQGGRVAWFRTGDDTTISRDAPAAPASVVWTLMTGTGRAEAIRVTVNGKEAVAEPLAAASPGVSTVKFALPEGVSGEVEVEISVGEATVRGTLFVAE